MAGKQINSDGSVQPRVNASSTRLASLRTATDTSTAPARRPKFVPKAAKRRPATENDGDISISGPQRSHDAKLHSAGPGALKHDNRGRGEYGRRGGRGGRGAGRGRGSGRGRGVLPSGKVAFVGTLSGGSSYSGGGSTPAPRSADYSAAGGTGISVLDEEEMPGGKMPELKVEEVWPPVIKSVMEPMSLPIVRPPEPASAGAIFCDATGDIVALDDSLFFIQMPTTLPLSSAVSKCNSTEDQGMENEDDMKDQEVKKSKESNSTDESPDDGVFDHSIEAAPGGFIGKICVHKSGKMVLILGGKQFEVAAAQTPSFCEEVYAVNTTEKHLSILGNVERHLVVTPDFDVLLH
ncbi:hypothetical protein KXD40_005932 [Peronospora effusa]|uniref:DNA-directed RNA polymerase III subunit RPC4 n=1 Tax=Peronospora effusa TaxID=542832 RepID=A0A3M6VLZ1_9STRA|nr:hypothetical protein DD238_001498 [Peronospora effusa]RQM16816.1 hypothetical protein DD237_002485 [Peronospora effusa]UIZ27531.1 hypothetical protein KXD40_005932 [Peronospora effusa]